MREFQRREVLVGYDGTEPAGRAVDWAAGEAVRRHLPLEVVHVVDRGALVGAPEATPWDPSAADAVTAEGVARARAGRAGLAVTGATLPGSPRTVLVHAARQADLLVVGSRGRGELAGSVLGSVATAVTAHAPCPVVVVRGDRVLAPGPDRPIVVGVDDSAPAADALEYAADLAARSRAPLRIVCARQPTTADSWARAYWVAVSPDVDPVEVADEAARVVAGRARDDARRRHPDLTVQSLVAEGPAAGVILAHARDAALVVVGARGRGSVTGRFLGSVSHGVVHGAHCPVVVVPASARSRTDPADSAATAARQHG
jgi:nucleotide-binding universal stress UspA family protein